MLCVVLCVACCVLCVFLLFLFVVLFCCVLSVVYCVLCVVCCLLSVLCCLLFVVCCLLSVVYCLLSGVCCMLSVVCCLLSVVKGLTGPDELKNKRILPPPRQRAVRASQACSVFCFMFSVCVVLDLCVELLCVVFRVSGLWFRVSDFLIRV